MHVRRFAPRRLGGRLALLAVLPLFACTVLGGAAAGWMVAAQARQQQQAELDRAAAAVAGDLSALGATLAATATMLSPSLQIRRALESGDPAGITTRLEPALATARRVDPRIRALAVLRHDGPPVAWVGDALPETGPWPDSPEEGPALHLVANARGGLVLMASAPIPQHNGVPGIWLAAAAPLEPAVLGALAARAAGAVVLSAPAGRAATPAPPAALAGEATLALADGEALLRVLRPASAAGLRDAAWRGVAGAAALVLLAALPCVWFAARRQTRPVTEVAQALAGLAQGRRDAPLPPLRGAAAEILALRDALEAFRRAQAEREALDGRVRWLARHDSLTGLANRAAFMEALEAELAAPDRAVAVLLLDLDRLKTVNDALGHAAGDEMLRAAAAALAGEEGALAARLGGDEFALLLPGAGLPGAAAAAERLLAALAAPLRLTGGAEMRGGASLGYALRRPGEPASAARLLREAGLALRAAKRAGRGQARLFDAALDDREAERARLVSALRGALARDEFRLLFQPQVALRGGMTGVEALLRWRDAEGREIPPGCFIPLAEETGDIRAIGAWVLREAARFAAASPGLRVGVNVSAVQLRDPGFPAKLRAALAETGCPPGRLELEVTETALLDDSPATHRSFDEARACGVAMALDDFGAGHSSLALLRRFPFDRLKVDAAFAHGLGQDPAADAMMAAVIGMARALGMAVTVEGVETATQRQALAAMGCDEVQGYLFGPPLPPEALAAATARLREAAA